MIIDDINSQTAKQKVAQLEVKRTGDKIEIFTLINPFNCSIQMLEVQDLMYKMEEKLFLEKLTDKEFARLKKVIDAENLRRLKNVRK